MTKVEKIEFLARLFMYGAKVGYDVDITQVEYFIHSVASDMGLSSQGLRTSEFISMEHDGLSLPEEEVIARLRSQLIAENPG